MREARCHFVLIRPFRFWIIVSFVVAVQNSISGIFMPTFCFPVERNNKKKVSSKWVKMGGGIWGCCGAGIRPSFEWNSLPGSEFICISVALWLAEERWNENHSKLLTPAQELRRNAQPLLWCGGTEPALFLCLLHQSSRDCGGGREGTRGGRRERKWAKGRKGTARISSELGCGLKMNALFFFSSFPERHS